MFGSKESDSTNPENKGIVEIYSKKLKEMRDFSNRPIIVKWKK